jgi:hypothetical protein
LNRISKKHTKFCKKNNPQINMQPNTYPDGFPMNPQEAINAAYFLSDSERTEWRDWLKTATPEQELELVNILHQMWQDAQKTAVPQAFVEPAQVVPASANTFQAQPVEPSFGSIAPASPAPTMAPAAPVPAMVAPATPTPAAPHMEFVAQPVPVVPQVENTNPFAAPAPTSVAQPEPVTDLSEDDFAPAPTSQQAHEEVAIEHTPTVSTNPYFTEEDESEPEVAPEPTKPEPIVEPEISFEEEEVNEATAFSDNDFGGSFSSPAPVTKNPAPVAQPKNNNQPQKQSKQPQPVNQPKPTNNNNQQPTQKEDMDHKDFSKSLNVRKSVTQDKLEAVYKQYAKIKDEYATAFDRYESNQSEFLNKVMEVVINFESISTYYDSIMSKLFEMNSKIVQQAKEIADVRSQIDGSRSQATLPEQIDEVRDTIEKMKEDLEYNSRDIRNFRNDSRTRVSELAGQFAAFSSDTYKQEGLLSRLDIMRKEIHDLQRATGLSTNEERVKPKLASLPQVSRSSNNNQIMNKMNPAPAPKAKQIDARQRVNPSQSK